MRQHNRACRSPCRGAERHLGLRRTAHRQATGASGGNRRGRRAARRTPPRLDLKDLAARPASSCRAPRRSSTRSRIVRASYPREAGRRDRRSAARCLGRRMILELAESVASYAGLELDPDLDVTAVHHMYVECSGRSLEHHDHRRQHACPAPSSSSPSASSGSVGSSPNACRTRRSVDGGTLTCSPRRSQYSVATPTARASA